MEPELPQSPRNCPELPRNCLGTDPELPPELCYLSEFSWGLTSTAVTLFRAEGVEALWKLPAQSFDVRVRAVTMFRAEGVEALCKLPARSFDVRVRVDVLRSTSESLSKFIDHLVPRLCRSERARSSFAPTTLITKFRVDASLV